MYLDVFDENPYGTNCWLIVLEGSIDAVVVDLGFEFARVWVLLDAVGKRLVAVLLTHVHIDYVCDRCACALAGRRLAVCLSRSAVFGFVWVRILDRPSPRWCCPPRR